MAKREAEDLVGSQSLATEMLWAGNDGCSPRFPAAVHELASLLPPRVRTSTG